MRHWTAPNNAFIHGILKRLKFRKVFVKQQVVFLLLGRCSGFKTRALVGNNEQRSKQLLREIMIYISGEETL